MRINSNWQCYQIRGNIQANDLRLNASSRATSAPLGAPKKARLNFSTKGKLYAPGMEYYGSTTSANMKLNWVRMRTVNSRFFVNHVAAIKVESRMGGFLPDVANLLVPFGIKCSLGLTTVSENIT